MSTPVTVEIHEPAGGPLHYNTCPSRRRLTFFEDVTGEHGPEKRSVLVIDLQCAKPMAHPGVPHHEQLGMSRVQWETEDWMRKWYAP